MIGLSSFMLKNEYYKLIIKEGKWVKENKQTYLIIPTTLTNNSNDTLKYYSMSCSWQEFYSIDNDRLQIVRNDCLKNAPIILILAPKQSTTVKIRLVKTKSTDVSLIKFRIGFNLMQANNSNKKFDYNEEEQRKKKNVIWSNEISM